MRFGLAFLLIAGAGALLPFVLPPYALTITIAVTQALLIAIAMRGFSQHWNIEYEVPATEPHS